MFEDRGVLHAEHGAAVELVQAVEEWPGDAGISRSSPTMDRPRGAVSIAAPRAVVPFVVEIW